MESKLALLEALVGQLQREVDSMKSGEASSQLYPEAAGSDRPDELASKYRELQQKVDKIEGNLGVDKVVLTDVGDKVIVVVQTPLGSVPVTLPHTTNTGAKSRGGTLEPSGFSGSTMAVAPTFTGTIKGGPPAGMTTEQLQDFKKQTLQITQLQQKIKEIENRIVDSNGLIKRGEDVTTDLSTKVSDDVKEIYEYLDEINTTMSEKIASQRVEMEKLAGDTPQPINYDPFNYGEAYAGDVVDFEARKRIVEMDLLFQSLQIAMNQMKDSVRVSPSIDLGYKVVRLDQLVDATGFGPAIRNGELTTDNGLLVNQAATIYPPERRYPKKEAFQTDEEKEYQWSITDSIIQTMYRLEMELAALQKDGGGHEVHAKEYVEHSGSSHKLAKATEPVDESAIRHLVERECKSIINAQNTFFFDDKTPGPSSQDKGSEGLAVDKVLVSLREQIRHLEVQVDHILKHKHRRSKDEHSISHLLSQRTPFNPFTCKNIHSFYRQPVKLRYLLQRVYRYKTASDKHHYHKIPRTSGLGYEKAWPKATANALERVENRGQRAVRQIQRAENISSIVEPQTQELLIKGKDGRWYRGDIAKHKAFSHKY